MATSPKSARICDALRERIRCGSLTNGSKLPPRRALCEMFGASANTISLSLQVLAEEGLIERRERSGVFIRGGKTVETDREYTQLNLERTAAEKAAEDLTREIALGHFRAGDFLPLRKALRFQFGVSAGTLAKALALLQKRKLIRRVGNAFVVGMDSRRRPASNLRVMILPIRTAAGNMLLRSLNSSEFLQAFERELGRNGVSFSGQFDRKAGGIVSPHASSSGDKLGYIYPIAGTRLVDDIVAGNIALLEREMSRLQRLEIPVVLYNCGPLMNAFPAFSYAKFTTIFPLGINNVASGEDVGRFLGRMGHNTVAFFSSFGDRWSQLRLQGLNRGLRTLCGKMHDVPAFVADYDRVAMRKNKDRHIHRLQDKLGDVVAHVFEIPSPLNPDSARDILQEFYRQLRIETERKTFEPLFQQALRLEATTAWVCADPTVAHTAAAFLSKTGIRVPQDISLITIDDNDDMANRGIAVYNLQYDRMGYLAAHCLLGDIPVGKNRKGIVECPGRIIERGSVARV